MRKTLSDFLEIWHIQFFYTRRYHHYHHFIEAFKRCKGSHENSRISEKVTPAMRVEEKTRDEISRTLAKYIPKFLKQSKQSNPYILPNNTKY